MKRRQTGVLLRVLRSMKPYGGYLAGALVSAVFSVVTALLSPVLVGRAIDRIVAAGNVDFNGILYDAALLVATLALNALFQFLLARCTNAAAFRTVRDLRTRVFDKLNTVPLQTIDTMPHGDLVSRVVNDIDAVSDGLLQGVTQLFTGVFTILGTLGFMLAIRPSIALVVVLVTPLSLFVAGFIGRFSSKSFREQSATQGELSACIDEMIGNQKMVKAFGYEERSAEQFDEINARLQKCGVRAQFSSALSNPSTRFVNGVVYTAVGVIGAVTAVAGGGLTVGQISCFLSYANQYTKPFNEVTAILTQVQTAFAAARRVFAVLDGEDEMPEASPPVELSGCKGLVEIDHVDFAYTPARPLIRDFSLRARPGSRIAIVGPTGCGKTTMINLLMRFYDVDRGAIRIDGVDIRSMRRGDLRSLFGMVLQDTWLYSGTVRQNIAYGRPDATEEEVVAAAKAAHAHGFIMRLPKGYDTDISESGGEISQGQKQLLCIARVMLCDPPMLILDEATSNIDTITEVRVQKAFQKLIAGRTSFVVAHRLSTIRESDLILVMRDGNIVEQGTHDELLAQGGFYASIYQSQFAVRT